MKKIIAFLLAFAMLLALAACGAGGGSGAAQASDGDNAESAAETQAGELDNPEETEVEPKEDKAGLTESEEATIEETVLADEELFRITANSLTYERGPVLTLTLENKSDLTLSFTSQETNGMVNTINGYAGNTGIYEVVGPGESVVTQLGLGSEAGLAIGTIADIQHGFTVRDDDTYDLIAYVPTHLQTSAADYDYSAESFQNTARDSDYWLRQNMELIYFTDEVDYDCCGIRILSAAVVEGNGRHWLYIEFENTTEDNLRFYSKAVAFNGLYQSAKIDSVLVPAGKKAVSRTDLRGFDDITAALFGIEKIDEITVIGAVTTEDNDNVMNIQGTLGYETFTLSLTDEGKAFSYESLEETVNEAGIRLDTVAVVDTAESEGDIRFLFAVVNNSGEDVSIDLEDFQEEYSNVGFEFYTGKVNGNGAYIQGWAPDLLPEGGTALAILTLTAEDAEACGITSAADVTQLETLLTVTGDSGVILEAPISVNY